MPPCGIYCRHLIVANELLTFGAGFIVFIVRQIFTQLNEARHQNSFYLIEKHKLCGEVTQLWQ